MKRLLIALAILATVQNAGAQVKSAADAQKAVDAALKATENVKKAEKASTWIKLGEAYVGAYDAPSGSLWTGASKQELALVMGAVKPVSTESVVVNGEQMSKEVYSDKNLYFRANGQLALIEVTKPVVENALPKAVEAYQKAFSLDAKKSSDIANALNNISSKYVQEAYNKYSLGDTKSASALFELAAKTAETAPLSKIDTNSIYNAGFTAWSLKDTERAKSLFEKCYNYGYYAADGELFAKLADIDTVNTKKYLEEGFEKFPQSQSILIGLINYYLKSGESTDRLFELLDKAKANEPNNASLYYVEGNIKAQLGKKDEAIAAYRKCSDIDPNYEYGAIGEGILFYNNALDIQTKSQTELDDAKYMVLVAEFEKELKSCLEPFERAYKLTKADNVKVSVAEYLKNAYYRFRDEKPEYMEAYKKYAEIVSSGIPK